MFFIIVEMSTILDNSRAGTIVSKDKLLQYVQLTTFM